MRLWIHLLLVLCSLTLNYFVRSNACGLNEYCTLKNWVTTDCKPCCQMDAEPISAVQKRSLCCPKVANNVNDCANLCNFTASQIEQKGDCASYCTGKCPGDFHFRTTSTSTTTTLTTTTPPTSTTTTPTTTPSTTTTSTTTTSTTTTSTSTSATTPTTTPTTTTTTTTPTTTTSTTTTSTSNSATTPTTTTSPTTTATTVISTTRSTTTDTVLHVVYLSTTTASPTSKHCSHSYTTNKGAKKNAPLRISLVLAGVVVGSLSTLLIFWLVKRRKGKVTPDRRTPVKRKPASGQMYEPTYGKNKDRLGLRLNNDNPITGHRKPSTGLGDNLEF